jgi:hypothetical protein
MAEHENKTRSSSGVFGEVCHVGGMQFPLTK